MAAPVPPYYRRPLYRIIRRHFSSSLKLFLNFTLHFTVLEQVKNVSGVFQILKKFFTSHTINVIFLRFQSKIFNFVANLYDSAFFSQEKISQMYCNI